MCIALAASIGGVAVAAADTRASLIPVSGQTSYEDWGHKLAHVPGGWLAGSGDGILLNAGLDALTRLQTPDPDALDAEVQRVYAERDDLIRAAYPKAEPDRTVFNLARIGPDGASVVRFEPGQDSVEFGDGRYVVSWPKALTPDDIIRLSREFEGAAGRASAPDIIRAVAELVAAVSDIAAGVSPSVEIGLAMPYGTAVAYSFTAGDSATLAGATDQQINEAGGPPRDWTMPPQVRPYMKVAA